MRIVMMRAVLVPVVLFGAIAAVPESHGAPDEKCVEISVRLGESRWDADPEERPKTYIDSKTVVKEKTSFKTLQGGIVHLPQTAEPADLTHGFKLEGSIGSTRNNQIHVDLTVTYIGHGILDDGAHQFDTVATRLFREIPIGKTLRIRRAGDGGPGWMDLTIKPCSE